MHLPRTPSAAARASQRRYANLKRQLAQVTLERDDALRQLAAALSMADLRTSQLQRATRSVRSPIRRRYHVLVP